MVKQIYCEYHIKNAGMAELADAIDLGSIGNTVQVQVLLPALQNAKADVFIGVCFFAFDY